MTFAANAASYWVHGQIFGNPEWASVELIKNETTGKYEKIGTLAAGEFVVKVIGDDNKESWWKAPDNTNINTAGTYSLSTSGDNYSSTLAGNYTVSLTVDNDGNPQDITFTEYTGEITEGPASYVLRGDCFTGSWDDREMTESDGVWTWKGEIHTGKTLGIKKMVDGVQKGWYWAPTNRPGIISDAGTYLVVLEDGDNGKNLTTKVSGEFTFTFDPEKLELKVEGVNQGGSEFDVYDFYFVGKRNGWSATEAYKMTKEDNGDYVLDMNITMNPEWPFKFNNGNFTDDYDWGANAAGDKVTPGVEYALGGQGSGDLYVSEPIMNPHIVFNPENSTLLITSRGDQPTEPDPDLDHPVLYLTGSFQSNPWVLGAEKYKFTREGDVYTLNYTGTFSDTELFKIADNTWTDDIDFGSNANDDKVVPGVPYVTAKHAAVEGNDHNLSLEKSLIDPKFVFDISTQTLTVTGTEVVVENPTELHYYVKGNIFTGAWDGEGAVEEFTLTDGKYVLADKEVQAGSFGIMVLDLKSEEENKQVAWYGTEEETTVELDKTITLTGEEGCKNLAIAKGKYTFTFDLENMTLVVTGEELPDVPPVIGYMIHGNNGDGWASTAMTETDGKWSVTLDKALVEFGIKQVDTAHNDAQLAWIASADETPEIANYGSYTAKVGGTNWTSTLTGKVIYTFDPTTLTLTVDDETGVSAIEAEEGEAVYYNLQGVRIEKPVKGAYIRVVNGKAVKVMK